MTMLTDGARGSGLSAAKQALLRRRLSGAQTSPVEVITRRSGTGPDPLSPAQRGLWLIDRLLADNASYSVHRALWLRGPLDVTVLRRALDALVCRHDVLRTTVRGDSQVVSQPPAAYFVVDEVAGPSAAQRRARARELAEREVSTGFDLEAGPLFRVRLFRIDPDEHLLVVNMHHMITDGWSCGLLARDLGQFYSAYLTGDEPRLPDLPIQYGDYAAWQSERMRGALLDAELAYWTEALGDVPHALELPTDYLRASRPTYQGRTITGSLPPDLAAAVRRMAAGAGTTVHTVLLTAFAALLSQYCSQRRYALGSLLAGRERAETEHLLGLFANTVAIPIDLTGEPTFEEALARIHRAVVGVLDHQDVSFDQVVTSLAPVRDPSHNALFQVLFQCVESTEERWSLPDLEIEPADLDNGTAKVDLALIAVNGPAEIGLEFTYATDLFGPETAHRLLGYYASLLAQVLAEPARTLGNVRLVEGAERDLVVKTWNDTAVAFPDACVHELFQARVASDPAAVALVDVDGSIVTYGELNARANRVAHYLRSLGIGPESVVGLCVGHSVELFVGLWGILKAGAAYLPLDPTHPRARSRFMLADSGATVVVTVQPLLAVVPEDFTGRVLCLDRDRAEFAGFPDTDPVPLATPDNLIYVMFTSGSTGRPKGVLVTHRGVANYLLWCVDGYGLSGRSGAPMVGSIAFDLSVPNFLLPMIGGKDVTLLAEDDPVQALVDLVQRPGDFSLLKITPGYLDALRRLLPAQTRIDSIRTYVVGADEVRPETVAGWQRVAPESRIINEYGPTETVVGCSVYQIGPDFDPSIPVSIGRPIANLRMYVLDEWGQLAPPGVPGELYIGGVGVARGYGNRPGLTAERFVPDPYDPTPGARMYRTGDLARFRHNGDIDFLGRIDHQVKIRGYRVELGEVEARLLAHPAVREAVVVCRDIGDHRRLIGYVVPGPGEAVTPAEVKSFVAAVLPDYMVPAIVVVLDRMPLTAGNKVDRTALPDPAGMAEHDRPAAPRSAAEETLVGIWGRALGVQQVGIHDNFFALGGDSLLSIRVVEDARRAGLALTPALMFSHQTVAELAEIVSTVDAAVEITAEQGLVTGDVALTPIQRWFTALDWPHESYQQAVRIDYPEPPDEAALRTALRALLDHHDALRLRMRRDADGWGQWLSATENADPLWVADLTGVADADAAMRRHADEAHGSLRLATGPLLRAVLFRRGGAGPDVLLLVAHVVAVDRLSWDILLADLADAYRAALAGRPVRLPPKTTSFRHWARRLVEFANSPEFESEARFWRQRSAELAALAPLPTDRPDGGKPSGDADTVIVALPADETGRLLRQVTAGYRARIEELLLTALAGAAKAVWGTAEVAVHVESHGREPLFADVDLSRTVGWFTAVHPVVLRASGDQPARWVRAVKEELRGIPRRGIGYGLARYLRDGEPAVHAAPGICFKYLGATEEVAAGRRPYLLDITAYLAGEELRVSWAYGRERHDEATVVALAQAFRAALRALARTHASGSGAVVASDFPLAGLGRTALDRLAADQDLAGVADVYQLSPLQTGMLFQSVATPDRGDYVEQFVFVLTGPLDSGALRAAWQRMTDRHGTLRTRFAWRGLPHPVQLVGREAEVDWQELDWRDVPAPDRTARLAALLEADRTRGFDLDRAPPHRYLLIRTGAAEHRLVWSFHHMLLDGWSMPLLFAELMAVYAALAAGVPAPELPEPVPLRRYAAWLAEQDPDAGATFWRDTLAGVTGATPISVVVSEEDAQRSSEDRGGDRVLTATCAMSDAETERVREFARAHRVTVGTVLQAAWALLLARDSGRPDVVFGTLLSGRSGQVPELDRVVGMLMNTVPTRVRVVDEPIGDWLRGLHGASVAARQYEHWSLADVQRAAGIPGRRLFDSIFVYENFPVPDYADPSGLRTRLDHVYRQTGNPLVLGASLHDQLDFLLNADRPRVTHDAVASDLLTAYRTVLDELLAPAARLADLAPVFDPQIAVAPAAPAPLSQAPYRPPQNDAERVLTGIWADVLGLSRVGVDDDFLDLGGDSILAMQIVARARDAGLVCRPSDVYRYPTVARLAARAAGPAPATAAPNEVAPEDPPPAEFPLAGLDEPTLRELLSTLDLAEVEDIYRLTPTQVGMLFQRLATQGEDVYFRQRVVDLHGELDLAAFRQSWQHVIDRHPALRTRFVWDGLPHPVQVVSRRTPVTIEERDARDIPEPERASWLDRLLADERARGVDLGAASPQRLVLVRTGERAHRFILNTHHLLLDGWSHAIISRELINAYAAFAVGRRPPDAGQQVPLRGYYEWLDGRSGDAEYWRRIFDGWSGPTPLPFAQERREDSHGSAIDRRTAPAELAGQLRELVRTTRVTLHTVLRSAWGLLLSRHSGQQSVVFGTMLAGRSADVSNIERMVGMLMNTLPTVVRVDPDATVGDWLRRGYTEQLELDEHAHCTLGEVRRAARVTGGPMFESLFVFNNFNAEPPRTDGPLAWIDVEPPVGGAGYPLVLTVEQDQTLSVAVKYECDRYDPASVSLVIEQYLSLLGALAAAGSDAAVGTLLSPDGTPTQPDSAERVLHRIWGSVLNADPIGPHDDFFALGGDSILAFEVVARARRAGLSITVQDVVAYRTIAGLTASLEGTASPATAAAPTPALGASLLPRLRPDAPELLTAMARHRVAGVSVAVVEDGRLARAWGQGVTRAGGAEAVGPRTPFRACSISKHVTAVGVLRLVQDGLLDLDVDVREYQTDWRLPVPPDVPPVTLRRLLSHTAGLNAAPSIGYRRDEPVPSLRDLLTGAPPARSAPLRLELTPGAGFRYARAHYLIIQQILTEVTGRRFDELMRELVLAPLGMVDSSFDQSFPLHSQVALGHEPDGGCPPEGWLVYPELAASGLWTTPSDLARLAIEILRAASGAPGGAVLGRDLAIEMVCAVPGAGYGLGSIAVAHTGRRWFGHAGDDDTYQCLSIANLDDGSGVAIMANIGGGLRFITELLTELDFTVPPSPEGGRR